MEQTIIKNQIYGFIGHGYKVRGYGNYVKIYVVRAKINGFDEYPQHWNREFFEEIESTGKLNCRSTKRCAYRRRLNTIEKTYSNITWM